MTVEEAYHILYIGSVIILLILIGVMLLRAIIGPRIPDRILSINMIGTMTICVITILSRLLDESWLIDVALIYAMVSLVTVLMLAAMYIPADPKPPVFPGRAADASGHGLLNLNRAHTEHVTAEQEGAAPLPHTQKRHKKRRRT